MKNKIRKSLVVLITCMILLSACSLGNAASKDSQSTPYEDLIEVEYSERDLNGTYDTETATLITLDQENASVSGDGAEVEDKIITISKEGVYVVSGTWNDGQIKVSAGESDKVQLVLNNANITCQDSSAIYIEQADKVFLTLAEGSENRITDGASYQLAEGADEPNAAIFSKDDLTINGSGKLTVNANYQNGILTKDDLKITGGDLTIEAVNDGLRGKDSVAICDGKIQITAGGDGIQSNNDTDTEKGWIVIEGGAFQINAQKDGLQAETKLQITDGTIDVVSGNGNENSMKTHMEAKPIGGAQPSNTGKGMREADSAETRTQNGPQGMQAPPATGDTPEKQQPSVPSEQGDSQVEEDTESETTSAKGLKAGVSIYISEGTISVDASDDSVHSNGMVRIDGGNLSLKSGDDGIHANTTLTVNAGSVQVLTSYEGMEAENVIINGGDISIVASDDGLNAASQGEDSDEEETGQQRGMDAAEDVSIVINGGSVLIDAGGDGIDSNGALEITGGVIAVSGPVNNGNGALDYNGEAIISGGTFIASGSSGMAQNFSSAENQGSIMVNFSSTIEAGTVVALLDEDGNTVLSYTSNKEFQNIVISSPKIEEGKTYTLYTGGSTSGELINGIDTQGVYKPGTEKLTISMDELIVGLSEDGSSISNQGPQGPSQGGRPNSPNGTTKTQENQN